MYKSCISPTESEASPSTPITTTTTTTTSVAAPKAWNSLPTDLNGRFQTTLEDLALQTGL